MKNRQMLKKMKYVIIQSNKLISRNDNIIYFKFEIKDQTHSQFI